MLSKVEFRITDYELERDLRFCLVFVEYLFYG